jgi:hypothetical protein
MLVEDYQTTNDLKKAIKEMVAFFDLFDFPLTAQEISHYLDGRFSWLEISVALESLSIINNRHGQYFLKGREEIILSRQKKYNYYCRKLKIAQRFGRLFAVCPSVRAVFLSNVIGPHNLRDSSDIDFFIITKPGQIWLARLYCTGLAAFLNKRPQKNNKRDKICLSFYISSDQFDLSGLKLKPLDPYFNYWLRNLVLLYNKDRTHEDFLRANHLPIRVLQKNSEIHQTMEKTPSEETSKNLKVRFLIVCERIAKNFQLAIMNPALKLAANNSLGVVINDKILKLYLKDNRQEYLEKYGNKLQQVFAQND